MFSHIMIGSNDMARSKKFYDALFAAMGAGPGVEDARGRLAYSHNGGRFMVSKPIDGRPASVLNGGTIGFQMKDAAQAEAWHNILLMGIIEEAEGVQNIRDILRQVRGIGAIWAGPGDMSVSMGLRGQASHPAVQENLLRVLAACKEFDVPCATGATADEVAMRPEQGFRIIMTSPVRSTPGLVEGRRLAVR